MATVTHVIKLYGDGSPKAEIASDHVGAIVYTTVAADIATLVADGATPTQAHVTSLNTHWGALKALIDTATGKVSANLIVQYDSASFTTAAQLRDALFEVVHAAIASGRVTK